MELTRQPHRITERPKFIRAGEIAFFAERKKFEKRDELAMILEFITWRELFGYVYSGLDYVYFHKMPKNSGLFVLPVLQTHVLMPGVHQPGDIDILIIPYENEYLILEKTLAIEVKIVRASYNKQGKSPNEFGFTQASQLIKLGFPYVSVLHMIVSDHSPRDAWRETSIFQMVGDDGRVEPRPAQLTDMMPWDLINRAFGRLSSVCPDPRIGISAAYIGPFHNNNSRSQNERSGLWIPRSRKCIMNLNKSDFLLDRVGKFFDKYAQYFLDNPRFDP